MFPVRRAVLAATRTRLVAAPPQLARAGFATSARFAEKSVQIPGRGEIKVKTFDEVKTEADLVGPGSAPGTIPTDIEQATGLERLEILGKMEGIDVFDMKPLDASRKGTLDNPITVQSFGEERYLGCTGYPADSHVTIWLTVSKDRPIERCPECGSVYKMNYVGPEEDPHAHDHAHDHGHGEPHFPPQKDVETLADFVKPQYW